MSVDQATRRRLMRTGLTGLDEEKASPGYTLYAPMFGPHGPILLDQQGNEVHRWDLPYPPGLYGYLLPNGNLFYLGKTTDETTGKRFPPWDRFKGGVMMEVDWDGNVLWEHYDINHHHDGRRTESGGAIYLTVERVPEDVAAKVKGGALGTDAKGGMWADVLVEVDASGKRIWEWHAQEHLDFENDVITTNDSREEWSHGNTIAPLDGGRVLVSFRNISTVAIINKQTGAFEWKLGYDVLSQQHDPNMLSNGNVLIFDNGTHRKAFPRPYSRVIEVDPKTNEIVWEYKDAPITNFFSGYISGARRLPNGNTLITEGQSGRMFQVTPEKEVVWEYVNPHFEPDAEGALTNNVFRATHYLREDVPGLG